MDSPAADGYDGEVSPAMHALAAVLVLAPRGPALAADPIPWEDAKKHIGEEVVVEGRVLGVHCSPTSCLLAFEPTFDRFTAIVQATNFDVFPPAQLEQRFNGRRVRVRGTVRMMDEKPEIELDQPDDIVLADAEEREAARTAEVADTQTRILERLEDVLAGIEELTERLLATQQRMDVMLAQLEQRNAQLAAASAPAPHAGPAVPPGMTVPPRPAAQALRSVKRGMSADNVRRLLGEPVAVEPAVGGGEIWHYGYGQSITFDGRARATSLVGLGAP